MHVALDDYIPFCEYFVIPYLMWFLYVGGAIVSFYLKAKKITTAYVRSFSPE